MATSTDTRVLLGEIAGAHGTRGEVRIRSYTERPQDIAAYGPLQDEAGACQFTISSLRPAKDGLIARIEGVATRDAAEALKGIALYADRAALPAPEEEETFYHADLVGLVAISPEGAALGQVVAVQNFGAGDLLELRPATGGPTLLVPFTREVVPEIDRAAGWLLLVPPEGLLEA